MSNPPPPRADPPLVEHVHYLAGQVNALEAFALALINTHPDLARLSREFHRISETQAAISLPRVWADEFLHGQAATKEALEAHIANRKATGL